MWRDSFDKYVRACTEKELRDLGDGTSESEDILVVHRDIDGTHECSDSPPYCWCEPHVFRGDTLLTPEQIVEICSVRDFKN